MSVKNTLGKSTFTILNHLGFHVLWDGVHMNSFDQCDVLGLTDDTIVEIALNSGDTTVTRVIRFADLWEEVPEILVAALAAWSFLVDPFGGK